MFCDVDGFMRGVASRTCEYFCSRTFANFYGNLDAALVLVMAECSAFAGSTDRAYGVDVVVYLSLYQFGKCSFVEFAVLERGDQCGCRTGDIVFHYFCSCVGVSVSCFFSMTVVE